MIGSVVLCGVSEAVYNDDNEDNTRKLHLLSPYNGPGKVVVLLFLKLEMGYLKITDSFLFLMMKMLAHLWSWLPFWEEKNSKRAHCVI